MGEYYVVTRVKQRAVNINEPPADTKPLLRSIFLPDYQPNALVNAFVILVLILTLPRLSQHSCRHL